MNSVFEIGLSVVAIAYVGLAVSFALAIRRRLPERHDYEPRVSVVVAARDEEQNLPQCLMSLANLDYPTNKLEIITVDHSSKDRTPQILYEFSSKFSHFRTLRASTRPANLSGKAIAVATGIKRSTGDLIFLTDADCVVPKTWIRSLLRQFDKGVGVVGGFTLLGRSPKGATNWFVGAQCLDWLFLLSTAAGACALGRPLTWVGNNLAIRRRAYDEIGGYRSLRFSVTEDFSLLKAIYEKSRWAVSFSPCQESLVLTKPAQSLGEFYRQRLRWAIGGRTVHPLGKALIALGIGARLLSLSALFVALQPVSIVFPFVLLASDIILLSAAARRLGRSELLKYILQFEAFFLAYTLVVGASLPFVSTIRWKNIQYPIRDAKTPVDLSHPTIPSAGFRLTRETAVQEVEVSQQT